MALSALKKITVKDVMKGKPEREVVTVMVQNPADIDGPKIESKQSVVKAQDVCLIMGRAHSHETGSTTFGPYTTFIGSFEARRLKDGEIFQSTRIILPPIADGIGQEVYMNAKKEDPNNDVEFAFIVGVEHDERGTEGYKFTCKPISTGTNSVDPLAQMRSALYDQLASALPSETFAKISSGFTRNTSDPVLAAPSEPAAVEDKTKGKGAKAEAEAQ